MAAPPSIAGFTFAQSDEVAVEGFRFESDEEAETGPQIPGFTFEREEGVLSRIGRTLKAGAGLTAAAALRPLQRVDELAAGALSLLPDVAPVDAAEEFFEGQGQMIGNMIEEVRPPRSEGLVGMGEDLFVEAPTIVGEFAATRGLLRGAGASKNVAGSGGFGIPEAIRGGEEGGPVEAARRGVTGAVLGRAFEAAPAVSRAQSALGFGAAGAVEGAERGGAEGAAVQGAVQGGIGALIGRGKSGRVVRPEAGPTQRAKVKPVPDRPGEFRVTRTGEAKDGRVLEEGQIVDRSGNVATEAPPTPKTEAAVGSELAPGVEARAESALARDTEGQVPFGTTGAKHEAGGPAGRFNTERIAGPDDFKVAVEASLEDAGPIVTERLRGGMTEAQIVKEGTRIAEEMIGAAPGTLLKRGTALNAEGITAFRLRHNTIIRDWFDVAKTIRAGDNSAPMKSRFLKLQAMAEASASEVRGLSEEAGRALQSLKIIADESMVLSPKQLQKMIQATEISTNATVESMAERVAKTIEEGGVPERVAATGSDMFIEFFVNMLLTGIKTQVVNVAGNVGQLFSTVPETFFAGGGGAARTVLRRAVGMPPPADRVFLREATARAMGMVQSFPEAVSGLVRALRAEEFPTFSKFSGRRASIPGPVGKVVRLPSRGLSAMDEFFKTLARRQELNARAYREGIKSGLSGRELAEFVGESVSKPTAEARVAAQGFARTQTFQEPLGKRGQAVQAIFSGTVGRIINPFVRIGINLTKEAGRKSPLGFTRLLVKGKTGVERDVVIGKAIFGTGMATWAAMHFANGNLTGAAPSNPAQRGLFFRSGRRPYSIRIDSTVARLIERNLGMQPGELGSSNANEEIGLAPNGDLWVSYGRLDPFSTVLGMSADLAKAAQYADDGEIAEAVNTLQRGVSENIKNKNYLRQVSDIMGALNSSNQSAGMRFLTNAIATLGQPATIVADVARAQDPILRESVGLLDRLKQRIPGQSDNLGARIDPYGETIFRDTGIGPDFASPFYATRVGRDKAVEEPLRLNANYAKPRRSFRIQGVDVKLTAEQYERLQREGGRLAKLAIDKFVNHPKYDKIPDPIKKIELEELYRASFEKARTRGKLRIGADQLRQAVKDFIEGIQPGATAGATP